MSSLIRARKSARKSLSNCIANFSRRPIYNAASKGLFSRITLSSSDRPSETKKSLHTSQSFRTSSRDPCKLRSNVTENKGSSAGSSSSRNPHENIRAGSMGGCKVSSTVSRTDSKVSNCSSSPPADPCSRACKISPSPVCRPDSCAKDKTCPEPPPGICEPTEGKITHYSPAITISTMQLIK